MKITKEMLDNFAACFNEANIKDDEPMQNRAKDGAAIVLGAMNGYLFLMRDSDENYADNAEYKAICKAFQNVCGWFVSELDLETWQHVTGKDVERSKIMLEPKEL